MVYTTQHFRVVTAGQDISVYDKDKGTLFLQWAMNDFNKIDFFDKQERLEEYIFQKLELLYKLLKS